MLSEFLGTFWLVFLGCGSIMMNAGIPGFPGIIGIPLAFGAAVGTAILILKPFSGAHINPAVSLAMGLEGRLKAADVFAYAASQAAGAITAAFNLRWLWGELGQVGASKPTVAPMLAFLVETVLAGILVYAIFYLGSKGKSVSYSALAVGIVIFLEALLAGPLTGASMNPARSLGPALASGELEHLWIYLTAPFLGAAAARGIFVRL